MVDYIRSIAVHLLERIGNIKMVLTEDEFIKIKMLSGGDLCSNLNGFDLAVTSVELHRWASKAGYTHMYIDKYYDKYAILQNNAVGTIFYKNFATQDQAKNFIANVNNLINNRDKFLELPYYYSNILDAGFTHKKLKICDKEFDIMCENEHQKFHSLLYITAAYAIGIDVVDLKTTENHWKEFMDPDDMPEDCLNIVNFPPYSTEFHEVKKLNFWISKKTKNDFYIEIDADVRYKQDDVWFRFNRQIYLQDPEECKKFYNHVELMKGIH